MADSLFDLYFSGKISKGEELEQVRLKVSRIFSADNETLDRLFSGKPVRIKSGVDQDTAIRYRVALRDAGALLDIRPQRTTSETALSPTETEPKTTLSALPPNTGDLTDCAVPVDPFPLPDISNIILAPAGVDIDESDLVPPQNFNTDGLTLAAPNTGSLEDCRPPVEAKPIPDINHIELIQDETATSTNQRNND
ncbi:MAG: hypothetical protein GY792_03480 [Gammaproteobacteria bacterium]|nr:hypothetical protein [Gammaproteobacteria bacterium]